MKPFIKLTILTFVLIFAGCWNMYNDTISDMDDGYKFFFALINITDTTPLSTFSFNSDNTLNVSSKISIGSTLSYPTFGAVHPSGNYLYVTNHGNYYSDRNSVGDGTTLSMFSVKKDGSLASLGTPTNTIVTGTGPFAIKIHPSGNYVYVTNDGSDNISMYQVNGDGTLASIGTTGTVSTGTYPKGLAIHPSGNYLYVANYDGLSISMYSIENGLLTALSSSPLSTGAGNYPWDIIVHPNGNYAYVTIYDSSYGKIFVYNITDGVLDYSDSYTILDYGSPYNIVMHPSGQYIYVANYSSVDAYTVNESNGSISLLNRLQDSSEIGGSTCAITIDPNGKYLYTSAWGSNAVGFIGLLNTGEIDLSNYLGYYYSDGVPESSPMGMVIIRKKVN